ncbi:hypothetical protein VQ056_09590 [Paenibacillus sp. JTLBN-2024]
MKQLNAASLSDIITEGIDKTLAKAMPNAGPDELEHRRQQMSKAELMDAYLLSFDQDLTGQVIHEVVLRVFGLDLDHAMVLPEAEREIRAAAERRLGECKLAAARSLPATSSICSWPNAAGGWQDLKFAAC